VSVPVWTKEELADHRLPARSWSIGRLRTEISLVERKNVRLSDRESRERVNRANR
jgi:hypothetical protein